MLGSVISGAASIGGGLLSANSSNKARKNQNAYNTKVMKNQLQWKAADAEAAGISKHFAMGAPTVTAPGVSVGGGADLGTGLAAAGQDIGRAVDAQMSGSGRSNAQMQSILMEGATLDNDIKRTTIASNIANLRQAGSPPGLPTNPGAAMLPGQGNSVHIDGPKLDLKTRRDIADRHAPSNIPGESPGTAFYRNPQGGLSVFLPPEMAESFEQDKIGGLEWALRNRVAPFFGGGTPPSAQGGGLLPWEEYYFNRGSYDYRTRTTPGYGRFNTRR